MKNILLSLKNNLQINFTYFLIKNLIFLEKCFKYFSEKNNF